MAASGCELLGNGVEGRIVAERVRNQHRPLQGCENAQRLGVDAGLRRVWRLPCKNRFEPGDVGLEELARSMLDAGGEALQLRAEDAAKAHLPILPQGCSEESDVAGEKVVHRAVAVGWIAERCHETFRVGGDDRGAKVILGWEVVMSRMRLVAAARIISVVLVVGLPMLSLTWMYFCQPIDRPCQA